MKCPTYFHQVRFLKDTNDWLEAMKREVASLNQHGTYELVPRSSLSKSIEVLPSRFVYALKRDGRKKARLVAGGHRQTSSVFEDSNASPTIDPVSIRIFLYWAARNGLRLSCVDFDSAYLNANLPKPVYLEAPPGFAEVGGFDEIKQTDYSEIKKNGYSEIQKTYFTQVGNFDKIQTSPRKYDGYDRSQSRSNQETKYKTQTRPRLEASPYRPQARPDQNYDSGKTQTRPQVPSYSRQTQSRPRNDRPISKTQARPRQGYYENQTQSRSRNQDSRKGPQTRPRNQYTKYVSESRPRKSSQQKNRSQARPRQESKSPYRVFRPHHNVHNRPNDQNEYDRICAAKQKTHTRPEAPQKSLRSEGGLETLVPNSQNPTTHPKFSNWNNRPVPVQTQGKTTRPAPLR